MEKICGIYLIENIKTGQKYIGQSVDIHRRWQRHCCKTNNNGTYIDNSIKKYGFNNFKFNVIEKLNKNQDLLNEREQYWIKKYNTYEDKSHYNLTPGGKSLIGKNHPMYGKKFSNEARINMSKSRNKVGY